MNKYILDGKEISEDEMLSVLLEEVSEDLKRRIFIKGDIPKTLQTKPKYYDVIIRDMEENKNVVVREIGKLNKSNYGQEYIRLWKLGNLEHKIYPTKEAFERLYNILSKWDGNSTMDIVWSPDLEVEVIKI